MKKRICDILVDAGLAVYHGDDYTIHYVDEKDGKRYHKKKVVACYSEIETECVEEELSKGCPRVAMSYCLTGYDLHNTLKCVGTQKVVNGRGKNKQVENIFEYDTDVINDTKHKVYLGILTRLAVDRLIPKGMVHIWVENKYIDTGFIYVHGGCEIEQGGVYERK